MPHGTIVELLALTLGAEKADALWIDAMRGLAIPVADAYAREQAMSVLESLANAPGPPGLAARIARLRLRQDEPESSSQRPMSGEPAPRSGEPPPPSTPPPAASSPAPGPLDIAGELLALLSPSLGVDKATEALQQYARILRLQTPLLTRHDAVALLDAMSGAAGLLGVVARFAKVRFLLRFPG